MTNTLAKIDWWKANAIWGVITLIQSWLIWFSSNSKVSPVLLLIMSFFGLLFSIGFWQKSKVIFYISLVIGIISIVNQISRGFHIPTYNYVNYVLYFVLMGGLTWKVLIYKK
jgi:hypothetical protein